MVSQSFGKAIPKWFSSVSERDFHNGIFEKHFRNEFLVLKWFLLMIFGYDFGL